MNNMEKTRWISRIALDNQKALINLAKMAMDANDPLTREALEDLFEEASEALVEAYSDVSYNLREYYLEADQINKGLVTPITKDPIDSAIDVIAKDFGAPKCKSKQLNDWLAGYMQN